MYQYKAHIDRVIDGDTYEATVRLGFGVAITQRLRLRGLDTPETHRPRSEKEREHGLAATEYVRDLIEGRDVTVTTHKTGKYGRWLADIECDVGDLANNLRYVGLEKKESY